MKLSINGQFYEGEDETDCVWQYLSSCGYPAHKEEHGRRIAALIVEEQHMKTIRRAALKKRAQLDANNPRGADGKTSMSQTRR